MDKKEEYLKDVKELLNSEINLKPKIREKLELILKDKKEFEKVYNNHINVYKSFERFKIRLKNYNKEEAIIMNKKISEAEKDALLNELHDKFRLEEKNIKNGNKRKNKCSNCNQEVTKLNGFYECKKCKTYFIGYFKKDEENKK